MKIAVMGSWNTDGGVSKHTTPIVEWMVSQGHVIRVFSHYRESPHGRMLDIDDEEFVTRCYTTEGRQLNGFKSFDSKLLLNTVKQEKFEIFLLEDLGMLPFRELPPVLQELNKIGLKIFLINHDNKPKPSDHGFWKCLEHVDGVINILPEQNEFMAKYYPEERIYLIEYPCYPICKVNKRETRDKLNLPDGRRLILMMLGAYDVIAPLKAIDELKKEYPDIYLLVLVHSEEEKIAVGKKISKCGYGPDYYEIRVENSSWHRKAEYVGAADAVILDKGEGNAGEGAVVSSTCYQLIGWNTPVLARANRYFLPFRDEILKYRNDEELKANLKLIIENPRIREKLLATARKFALEHSPEKICRQLLKIFTL